MTVAPSVAPAALLVRNARLATADGVAPLVDLAIAEGIFTAVGPAGGSDLPMGDGVEVIDVEGRLAVPGFVDSHLHLDKSRLAAAGRDDEPPSLDGAIALTHAAKAAFTPEDVYARGEQTLRRCIAHGTTRIRTQVEVDPVVGLRGLEGVLALAHDYAWAVDIEICVFPQEGLLGGEHLSLLAHALEKGGTVLGGAPYADTDPARQVNEIFSLAAGFDVDVDFHLDLADGPDGMALGLVCEKTERMGYEGRVTVGHLTQLSYLPPDRFAAACDQLASAGISVVVLPATDLYLMGRSATHARPRGVLPLGDLLDRGVPCAVATNNVLNAFTPYGDGSLLRMANLYANTCHVAGAGLAGCLDLVTSQAARVIGASAYGIEPGNRADLVVIDAPDARTAVAEPAVALWGMKAGRRTFTRTRPELHDPGDPIQ